MGRTHPRGTSEPATSRWMRAAHSATSRSSVRRERRRARRSRWRSEALRRKLDRRERVFDFVGDALCDFLPGRGFLRAQELREVVDHDDESRIRATRTERADRDRGMVQAAGLQRFRAPSTRRPCGASGASAGECRARRPRPQDRRAMCRRERPHRTFAERRN